MINLALVGMWHVHFKGYADQLASDPDCTITVLWDNDPVNGVKVANDYSCDFEPDYDKVLAREDVDAVMICSATSMHKELMIKAANAGKHIFTEKVLCFNYDDAKEIANAVKSSGVKFCISFPWRSRSDFLWIKNALDKGLVGNVNYCRMRNAHNGTVAGWLPDTFYDKETCGGGAMMDLGAHSTYILNWLLGVPKNASSVFTNVKVSSVEDNAVTVYEYDNGAIGVSETAFIASCDPFSLEVVGDKGTIFAGGFLDRVCYNVGDGWIFPNLPASAPSPMEYWIGSILNNTENPYGIDDAVALTATMEMAYNNIKE